MIRHPVGRWTPALAWMFFLAILSHRPDWPTPAQGKPDWLLHGLAYAVLGAACYWGAATPGRGAARIAATAVLVAVGYGVVDELHQGFVPGRDASPGDVLADAAGAVLVVASLTFARLWGVWEDPPEARRRPSR